MVDNGEQVSLTLKREFGEEAMNSIEESEREGTKKLIDELFTHGEVVSFLFLLFLFVCLKTAYRI